MDEEGIILLESGAPLLLEEQINIAAAFEGRLIGS